MIDTTELKQLPIREVAEKLGIVLTNIKANAKCFNINAHKNGDRRPSLGFSANNTFKCFACGLAGDTIELVIKYQGCNFTQACEWLQNTYSVRDIRTNTPRVRLSEAPQRIIAAEPYNEPPPPEKIAYRALYELGKTSQAIKQFLSAKGFDNETIEHFGWREIDDKAIRKLKADFNPELLEAAGITSNGRCIFEQHRVLIPYFDENQIIYLRGRDITDTAPHRFIGLKNKAVPLYNINALFTDLSQEPLYIAEGETDTMALHETGYAAVGVAGGQNKQVVARLAELLKTGFDGSVKLITIPDNDETGSKFAKELGEQLYWRGFKLTIKSLPSEYKDYTELLASKKRELVTV